MIDRTFPAQFATTLVLLIASPAWCSAGDDYVYNIEISGDDGASGDNGGAGDPASDGGAGQDGVSLEPGLISAEHDEIDAIFDVLITAGNGGDGGHGGDAHPSSGVPGSGGSGGHGGSLVTEVQANIDDVVSGSTIINGVAGDGGHGGDAGAGTGAIAYGGDGGDGGDITSVASGEVAYELVGSLQHRLTAGNGGNGGAGSHADTGGAGGRGGNIVLDSHVVSAGVGEAGNSARLSAGHGGNATEGGAGGAGGSVTVGQLTLDQVLGAGAQASSPSAGISLFNASVRAHGGNGGATVDGMAGNGGDVTIGSVLAVEDSVFGGDVLLDLTGGDGGDAFGSGRAGDGGSISVGSASATSLTFADFAWSWIELRANGGHGGNGFDLADAGDGASVSLDQVSHPESASVSVIFQTVVAGDAGVVEQGTVGQAGDATNIADLVGQSEQLSTNLFATGGAGSDRRATEGVAGMGGNALAAASAVNSGLEAYSIASATGGAGGVGYLGARGGIGGSAIAQSNAESIGVAVAMAQATGGSGELADGTAQAFAFAHAPDSSVDVIAATGDASVASVTATASAMVGSEASAMSSVSTIEIVPTTVPAANQAWTRATVLPTAADVSALIQANPDVAVNFDLSGGSDLFGYASVGAGYQAGEALDSYTHTAAFSIDASQVAESQNVLVGFLDATVSGDDFGGFLMTISVGTDVLLSQQGDEAASADMFLDDRTYDLGSLAGLAGIDGLLELEIAFILTGAAAGQGIEFDLVFGNSTLGIGAPVPLPGAVWLMLSGLLAIRYRSRSLHRQRTA